MAFKSILKTEKDFLKCKYVYCGKTQFRWTSGKAYKLINIEESGSINKNLKKTYKITIKGDDGVISKPHADEIGGEFIFTPFFLSKESYLKETDYWIMYEYFYVTTIESQDHNSWKITEGKKYRVVRLEPFDDARYTGDGMVTFQDDSGKLVRVNYDKANSLNDNWIFKLHTSLTKEQKLELMTSTNY